MAATGTCSEVFREEGLGLSVDKVWQSLIKLFQFRRLTGEHGIPKKDSGGQKVFGEKAAMGFCRVQLRRVNKFQERTVLWGWISHCQVVLVESQTVLFIRCAQKSLQIPQMLCVKHVWTTIAKATQKLVLRYIQNIFKKNKHNMTDITRFFCIVPHRSSPFVWPNCRNAWLRSFSWSLASACWSEAPSSLLGRTNFSQLGNHGKSTRNRSDISDKSSEIVYKLYKYTHIPFGNLT